LPTRLTIPQKSCPEPLNRNPHHLFQQPRSGAGQTFIFFLALIQITLSNRQRSIRVNIEWLVQFSKIALAECLKHPLHKATVLTGLENVDVIIVSDKVSADLHWRFMNVKGPTDVITFDHGEIIISAPMAQIYAKKYGKPLDHEIGLYVIHGLLHLNGYKDKAAEDARVIHNLQRRILAKCLAKLD
jgi:probable rRNA maturation factor